MNFEADRLAAMAAETTGDVYRPTGNTYRSEGRVWHQMLVNHPGATSGWVYWLRRCDGSYAGAHGCDAPGRM